MHNITAHRGTTAANDRVEVGRITPDTDPLLSYQIQITDRTGSVLNYVGLSEGRRSATPEALLAVCQDYYRVRGRDGQADAIGEILAELIIERAERRSQ